MAPSGESSVLADYFDLQRGTTYKSALLGGVGPVLLGLASIQRNGGFRDDALRTYGGDSPESLIARPGDLYVSLKDVTQAGDLLGAVARVPSHIPAGRVTQDTVRLLPKSPNTPEQYLYWLLRTPSYRRYCRAHSTGTTNLGLPRDDFLAFPVPPLTRDRRAIVAALEAIEAKLEVNRRMSETLEEMARTLFKSWFVDFDPVRAKVEGRDTGLPHHIADLFPDRLVDSNLGQIPAGWNAGHLHDVAHLNARTMRAGDLPSEVEYVDLSGTKWGEIKESTSYGAASAPSRARRELREGDTVVGTVRPGNGSYALVSRDGYVGSTGFAVLSAQRPGDKWLVYLAATGSVQIERLAALADGGAYPAVRPSVVHELPTIVAPEPVRDAFSGIAGDLLERVALNRSENTALSEVCDALLRELIG